MTNVFFAAVEAAYGTATLPSEIHVRHPEGLSWGRTMEDWFDGNLDDLTVGRSLGADAMAGAEDRWPVYSYGERVGTLYADASGLSFGDAHADATAAFKAADKDDLRSAVIERFNCAEVEIGDDGSVWIAEPQRGHWLDERAMAQLLDFVQDARA